MDEIPADVQALVRERRKIEAIKALRERTGIGLKEAKDRIDALERQLGLHYQGPSAATKSAIFWITLIVTAAFIWWISTLFSDR